ncbi:uncharacterized protein LOC119722841 [Patiria miniata]|uniref:G-protein coupled receptors family 2 profile 2 domain-containing protein n=1 Tax=Patiria miniata TaxID=46514 RepID=A0A913ZBH2_PATMI|nr:uncharacterized protein LOC119722841 [Patiria miniata]
MLNVYLLILVTFTTGGFGSDLESRLVGGPFSHEGRLEVQGPSGEWGSFCRGNLSSSADDNAFRVNELACGLCRLMGYLGSYTASNHQDVYGKADGVIWYKDGYCDCAQAPCKFEPWTLGGGSCDHRTDLSMTCLTTDLRLFNGSSDREGWLEIGLGGDRWVGLGENLPHSIHDADLVCQHFGFPLALAVSDGVDLPWNGDFPERLRRKKSCQADETITECLSRSICKSICGYGSGQFALFGVKCATDDEVLTLPESQEVFPEGIEVRLGDDDSQLSGILQLRHNGSDWGLACFHDAAQTQAAAKEACLRYGSSLVESTSLDPARTWNGGIEFVLRVDSQDKGHWMVVEDHCARNGGKAFTVTCKKGFTLNGVTVYLPDEATCEGFCGVPPSLLHTCGCDALCHAFQDCCFDVLSVCPSLLNQSADVDQQHSLYNLTHSSQYYACHYINDLNYNYQLISRCPESWSGAAVRDYCEAPDFAQAMLYHTGNEVYIGFKNIACALCHGFNAYREYEGETITFPSLPINPITPIPGDNDTTPVMVDWEPPPPHFVTPIFQEFAYYSIDNSADSIYLHACHPDGELISECPSFTPDEGLVESCAAYSAQVTARTDPRSFKNPHCALCNGIALEDIVLSLEISLPWCCHTFNNPYHILLEEPAPLVYWTYLAISVGEELECQTKNFVVVTKTRKTTSGVVERSPPRSQKTAFSALQCLLQATAVTNIDIVAAFGAPLDQQAMMFNNNTEETAHVSVPGFAHIGEFGALLSDILQREDGEGTNWKRRCGAAKVMLKEECQVLENTNNITECFQTEANVTATTINGTQYLYIGEGVLVIPFNLSLLTAYEEDKESMTYTKRNFAEVCGLVPKNMTCDFFPVDQAKWTEVGDRRVMTYQGSELDNSSFAIFPDGYVVVCTHTTVSYRNPFTGPEYIVQVVCVSLSLVALAATVVTYCVFPVLRNIHGLTVMSMSVAIFVGQFLLLVGVNQTESSIVCSAVAIVAHYAWLAAFAWMTAMAWDLMRTFSSTVSRAHGSACGRAFLRLSLFGWFSPFIVLIPCLVVNFCDCTDLTFSYGRPETKICWITDEAAILVTFGLPIVLSLCANTVFFSLTVKAIRATKKASSMVNEDKNKRKETTRELLIYVKISSVMGFAWIIGFIALATDISVLWFLFIISGALQGVFIFTSFAFNSRIRGMWRKKFRPTKMAPSDISNGRSLVSKNLRTVSDGTASASV